MKKIISLFVSCIMGVSAYANTCTFDNVQVSLKSEILEVIPNPVRNSEPYGLIEVTVSDSSKKQVRCQVQVGSQRAWVTINLNQGSGTYNVARELALPKGASYTVKLIQQGGACY